MAIKLERGFMVGLLWSPSREQKLPQEGIYGSLVSQKFLLLVRKGKLRRLLSATVESQMSSV